MIGKEPWRQRLTTDTSEVIMPPGMEPFQIGDKVRVEVHTVNDRRWVSVGCVISVTKVRPEER